MQRDRDRSYFPQISNQYIQTSYFRDLELKSLLYEHIYLYFFSLWLWAIFYLLGLELKWDHLLVYWDQNIEVSLPKMNIICRNNLRCHLFNKCRLSQNIFRSLRITWKKFHHLDCYILNEVAHQQLFLTKISYHYHSQILSTPYYPKDYVSSTFYKTTRRLLTMLNKLYNSVSMSSN